MDNLSLDECRKTWLWRESVRVLPELSDDQRAKVVNLARDVCGTCHDAPSRCKCWNDD